MLGRDEDMEANVGLTILDNRELMARKTKKAQKSTGKAKQNGKRLPSGSKDSNLSTCALESEDTPMAVAVGPSSGEQGEPMESSLALCKHLDKALTSKKFLKQIVNFSLLECKGCANLIENDFPRKKGKKVKGNKSTKKGTLKSKSLEQSEDDWPTSTWVCLTCGYVGCGSIPDLLLEDKTKVGIVKTSIEDTIDRGHAWQHCLGLNHPCALQCGDRLLCRCFPCRSTLQYDFSNATQEKGQVDYEGKLPQSLLRIWNIVHEKLLKNSTIVNATRSAIDEEISNEQSETILELDKADGLVSCDRVVKGLMNLGNTCFFNSVMQNLLALDVLRDHYTQSNTEFLGSLTCSLRKLYMETSVGSQRGDKAGELVTNFSNSGIRKGRKSRISWNSSHGIISPSSLFGAICAKAPRFKGFQQQDSHELLKYLLDNLKTEELNARNLRSKEPFELPEESKNGKLRDGRRRSMCTNEQNSHSDTVTFVDNIFGGQLSSTVCCCVCGFSSVTYERFLDLSLPIPTNESSKKSSLTPGQNKHASSSALENISEKKLLQKYDKKGKKRNGKKSQVSFKNKITVEEKMVVHSGECSPSVPLENITSATENALTTKEDSEQSLLGKQSAECLCQSGFDLTETMGQVQETDIQTIVHKCNGILLSGSKIMSVDCQARSGIYNNGIPVVDNSDIYNHIDRGDGVRFETANNNEAFAQAGNNKDRGNHFEVDSVITTDCEHVDMDCNGLDQLSNKETSCVQKQEEKQCEDENFELGLENGRHDSCETQMHAATEKTNKTRTEIISKTTIPMSIDGCFTFFTMPELLSGDNAWECARCSTRCGKENANNQTGRLGQDNTNDQTTKLKDGFITSDSEGGQNKTFSKRKAHIESSSNLSEACVQEEKDFDRTKELSNLNDQESGQLSTLQGRQVEAGDIGSKDIMQDVDAENESIALAKKPLTRSSLRLRERLCKEVGGDTIHKENFGQVNVHQQRSLRSHGRKQKLEKIESMETDLEPKKVMRDATKQYLISKAPQVLTIHLKRFARDMRGRLSKLSGHVTFQDKIDLSPYLDPKCNEKQNCTYCLTGVVEHSGSMRGGHYVAYVRGPQDENDQDNANDDLTGQSTWYYISDASVSKTSLSDVLRSEAYLLFYKKSIGMNDFYG